LFNEPPRAEDCPICFVPLPELLCGKGKSYFACCGKILCIGCVFTDVKNHRNPCPFCRAPPPEHTSDWLRDLNKRLEVNNPEAFFQIGVVYFNGNDVTQDKSKGLDFFFRGSELGSANASYQIANAYREGNDIAKDTKKALHYYGLAVMKGDNTSRCNLGINEATASRYDKALKHWQISRGRGHDASLEIVKRLFFQGRATKDDYEKALRSYQEYIDEIKSDQRDEAAAFNVDYIYLPQQNWQNGFSR
jgi:TPR repeat protein